MIKGIKYALNSSIGTKFFKPLDKMIDEAITLVPSKDSIFVSLGGFTIRTGEEKRFLINAVVDGGCYLVVNVSGEPLMDVDIYINGELVNSSNIFEDVSIPFYFKKGDTIEFSFVSDNSASVLSTNIMGAYRKRNALVEVR